MTVPGCCCCRPLLHDHLMDSCSYVCKNTLLAAKGGCIPLTLLNLSLVLRDHKFSSAEERVYICTHGSVCLHRHILTQVSRGWRSCLCCLFPLESNDHYTGPGGHQGMEYINLAHAKVGHNE